MEGPRAPLESEFNLVLDFLEHSLRPNAQWPIASEYPTALNLTNLNNMRVIFEEDQVVSHAVIKPMIVKTPLLLLKVGAIGSVVTDTAHRSKGFSRQIIENCLTSAKAQGCEIAILWTNLFDFYRKIGFELAGSEVSLVVSQDLGVDLNPFKILKSNKVDPEAILRCYNKHSVTSLRTAEEVRGFMNIPNTNVYTAWDTQNNLLAYAIEGKGADLNGYIHEWGGNVSALLALFQHIQAERAKPLTIISPRHCYNLIHRLEECGAHRTDGYLGMMKILKPEQLCGKIKKAARNLGIQDLIFEKQGDQYYIGRPGYVFKTDSDVDILRMIFGPQKPTDLYPFDNETSEMLAKIFPIQMWMWGWDSI